MFAELRETIGGEWLGLEPVRVGSVPAGLGTPNVYVTVADGDEAVLRIDVYADGSTESFCFSHACVWGDWVVVGFGCRLHLVRLRDGETVSYELDWYCGHLYVQEDHLIAASAKRLLCFDKEGSLVWRSEELGIDGVVVTETVGERIIGKGEWDPPGGWRPFEVDAISGKVIKSG